MLSSTKSVKNQSHKETEPFLKTEFIHFRMV